MPHARPRRAVAAISKRAVRHRSADATHANWATCAGMAGSRPRVFRTAHGSLSRCHVGNRLERVERHDQHQFSPVVPVDVHLVPSVSTRFTLPDGSKLDYKLAPSALRFPGVGIPAAFLGFNADVVCRTRHGRGPFSRIRRGQRRVPVGSGVPQKCQALSRLAPAVPRWGGVGMAPAGPAKTAPAESASGTVPTCVLDSPKLS